MRYVGTVYRPPSEAESLILQATIGCSWNRCSYCAMYLDKRFKPRPLDELKTDMDLAASYHGAENIRRVFLADGDALILRTTRLLEILRELRARFPNFQRASTYASPQALLSKSVAELAELKSAGLPLHYMGPETGHDEVLKRIEKGVTAAQMTEGGRRVIDAGAKLSVIFLLGIAGTELSHEHAVASGKLISALDPHYVSALTLVPVPGTKIHEEVEAGRLVMPDPRARLVELTTMLEHMHVTRAIFRSNHASNALPLGGNLPADKEKLLAVLRMVIADESIPLRAPPSPRRL
jgi:radical SAM superfamily enzyme YgiQ (UPF0313 family)